MRMRRFTEGVAGHPDLFDVPRHLAAQGQYDDLATVAKQATQTLPGTLAVAAYLAEVRPLIPADERAWILVTDLEMQTFLSAGDLGAADRLAENFHAGLTIAERLAALDSANAQWQRDLEYVRRRLADLAEGSGEGGRARDE